MAILTALSFEHASELLASYDLELSELSPLSAGSVNSNFFVQAKRRNGESISLFARIFEEQESDGAEFELLLNERLYQSDILVAAPLRKMDGGLYCLHNNKPFAVYRRLSGEVSCQARVNAARCFAVGRSLAQVHVADLRGLALNPSRFGFEQIAERLERVRASQREDLVAAVERLTSDSQRIFAARDSGLPLGLIHGDLFRDNVLLNGNEVSGLLDFESASLGPYVYDLMVAVLAWCYGAEFDVDLVRAMISGYETMRPLSKRERDALVTEGCVACIRFATTRLTDFSLRVPPGDVPGRDYGRFFARQDALESGVLERALT